jgi:hypothetical protein
LCEGITLDSKDMEVLDTALIGLDTKKRIPSRIINHNQRHGFGQPPRFAGNNIIVTLEKRRTKDSKELRLARVAQDRTGSGATPALHINLRSWALDIPQRIELSLRFVLKGLPAIEPTYAVYLHVLRMEDGQNLLYYGITRRGWMKRFSEHIQRAMHEESPLLFHRMLREGSGGRMRQITGTVHAEEAAKSSPCVLVGTHHVLCAAGLTAEQALDTEEHLVEKYSFGKPLGLNMIPGGKAGVAYLHKLSVLASDRRVVVDEEKEDLLRKYIESHPRKGLPNPLVAQRWLDDDYATRVICASDKRLSADQVRRIREVASAGQGVAVIQKIVNVHDKRRVQRVIDGKTYSRVR